MKCLKHRNDAGGICVYCGRALCEDCIESPTAIRIACSAGCTAALVRADQRIQKILQRSAESARASALYCYISAGLSAGAAVVAWFMLPSPFLILFTSACAVVLTVSGIWYGRGAKRHETDPV